MAAIDGDELARGSSAEGREEGERHGGEGKRSRGLRGVVLVHPEGRGASQAGRRWPARRRRSPPSCFVRWRDEEDGDAPGGLGRLGQQVSGLR